MMWDGLRAEDLVELSMFTCCRSDAFAKARTAMMADILSFGLDKVMGGKCALSTSLDIFTNQQLAAWTWR